MAIFTLQHNRYYEVPINTEILNLKAPGSSIDISRLFDCTILESINVDNTNHWYFSSVDGILYTKDMKELIRCPVAKRGTVVIPEGVEEIAYNAFCGCNINEVVFPSTLKRLKSKAFTRCKNLKTIRFGTGITSIGGYNGSSIFSHCQSLTCIELPPQLKEIYRYAFAYCPNLSSVKLNDGLDFIDDGVFFNCALEEIHIPDSVTKLGQKTFGDIKDVYSSKYIPGMVTASCSSFFRKGILKFYINDDVIHLPKWMSEEHIDTLENIFTSDYGKRDFGTALYHYAVDTEAKQYVAFKEYQKKHTKSLEVYLKRISKQLSETLIKTKKYDDFVALLGMDLMSKNTLQSVFEFVKGDAVLSAYVMNKMKKSEKVSFSL